MSDEEWLIDIEEWKRLAKERLLSGEMPEEEWRMVCDALLGVSETQGLGGFDEAIKKMSTDPRWIKE